MQNYFFKSLFKKTMVVTAAIALCFLSSCSDKDEPAVTPDPQAFEGVLSTTIPAMPDFEAVTSEVEVKIVWENPLQTSATLNIGAFTIETGMPGRGYAIGAMEISQISCVKDTEGAIILNKAEFSCQAGEYATTGNIVGEYQEGKLTFTMVYKPGSMPFDVQSTFVSK